MEYFPWDLGLRGSVVLLSSRGLQVLVGVILVVAAAVVDYACGGCGLWLQRDDEDNGDSERGLMQTAWVEKPTTRPRRCVCDSGGGGLQNLCTPGDIAIMYRVGLPFLGYTYEARFCRHHQTTPLTEAQLLDPG